MNNIIKISRAILPALIIAGILISACSNEDCTVGYSFTTIHEFTLSKNDSVETYYGHLLKAENIEITAKISPADSVYVPPDTTIAGTDTTITPGQTLYFPPDTTILSTKLLLVAKNQQLRNETEIDMAVGDTIFWGESNLGPNYSYIRITCEQINLVDKKAKIIVWNSRFQQNCGKW